MMKPCNLTTKNQITRFGTPNAFSLNEKDMPSDDVSKIADYLDVEKSKRYQPGNGKTYCNIYAYDVAFLFPCFLPRVWWNDPKSVTEDTKAKYAANCHEVNADQLYAWFEKHSHEFGWKKATTLEEAQDAVNKGNFAIVVADNKTPGHSGHITVVHPETDKVKAKGKDGFILVQTQAGSTNKRIFRKPWYTMPYFLAWGCWIFIKK